MKLFYLVNTIYNSGGIENVLFFKANELTTRYGYEVVIVTNHQKGRPAFFTLDPRVRHIDLNINTHLPWNRQRYINKLKALIEKEKPDIVDSFCYQELPYLYQLKGLCKAVMAEFHFSHETYRIKGQTRKLRSYEKAAGELDCFVVLTEEDRKAWAPYCSHLEQIYNPAEFPTGTLAPLEATRCISAGRFEKQKNYEDMVRVWKLVHQRHPDWILDLYGNGKKKKRIEKLVAKEGLGDTIHIHAATPAIREEMMGSSLYLMTSLFEGFPMVLAETASMGLPCVCTTCPCGPAEFIEDGVDGMLAAPGDIEAMAQKICTLIEQPELRREMGRRYSHKTEKLQPGIILQQWDALFKRLTAQSS